MKRIISVILLAMTLFCLTGCTAERQSQADKVVFKATVAEIEKGVMIVEPADGTDERKLTECVILPIRNMSPSPEPQAGDTVEITYSGLMTAVCSEDASQTFSIDGEDIYRITVIR